MARRIPAEAGKGQLLYEAILKWAVFSVGILHIAITMLGYVAISMARVLTRVEKAAIILLIAAALVYIMYTKKKTPQLMNRLQAFFKKLFCPELIILSLIFIWYLICIESANGRYTADFHAANKNYVYKVLTDVIIMFPMFCFFSEKDSQKMMEYLVHFFAIVLTPAMIYVLWNLFQLNIINLPDGGQIGMDAELRLSINCHGNMTGANAEIIMILCVCMAIRKKGIVRWLYAFASSVHLAVLILSNSRTTFIASTLTLALIAGKLVWTALEKKPRIKKILLAAAAGIVVAAILLCLRTAVFNVFENTTHLSEILNSQKAASAAGSAAVPAEDFDNGARTLNLNTSGRPKIWKASIQSVFSGAGNALFGVTPVGVSSEIKKFGGMEVAYTHNQFLEYAVAIGIPGLLLYCWWLFRVGKKAAGIAIQNKSAYMVLILLTLVTANMMEAMLLFYGNLSEVMFFLLAGMVIYSPKQAL